MASSHHMPQQYAQPNGHPASYPAQNPPLIDQFTKQKEETWVALGRAAETMGNSRSAIENFHNALKLNQFNVEALRHIASIHRAEDKYDNAVEYIQTILKIYPQDGEAFSSLGHCYLMMDELQQAYTAYQSALYNLRDPKEPKLWYGIGILYDRYGSLDHAEEAFTQVMRMAPDFDKANEIYFRLGIIYKQQSKYDQSLACFKYIVDSPPSPLNQTDIWFQIGHVYEQQKDYESAKAAYLKVLERDSHHAKVLQQLGWLHHQQSTDYNSQEQAIEFLEKSVSSDQTDAQSWYLLGRCYMSQHKFPKAYEAYQQAVYRDGRNPTFWCSIGVLYYQINQYRDALDAYSRAIRLNPNISEVWYDLGTLYESCNNQTNDALDAYNRAAELDPHNPQIKARVQLLRSGQSSQMSGGHPHPQDVPPQAYQPTGASGTTHSQWSGVPSHHATQHQQAPPPPPPPPLNASRDWNQRPGDVHGAPPQPQSHAPPPQLVNPYDQHRDGARPPHAPRPPSPRMEQTRHQDSYIHATRRPRSPSPRSRHPLTSTHRSAQSVSSSGPAPPQQQQHQHQPQLQPPPPPPPNRISNPNYGPQQHLPPTSSGVPSSSHAQNHLPPYSRGTPPPSHSSGPDVAPLNPDRLRSPRSTYTHQPSQPSYQHHHHHDPQGPSSIASGAPPPSSALAAAEAAAREREREREERGDIQSNTAKRMREWDDRDGLSGSNHKKMASEEARAKLEDPHSSRIASPASQPPKVERERVEPGPVSMPAPTSSTSPEIAKRADDVRQAEENYRPSAVAHQPAPLSTVLSQSGHKASEEVAAPAVPSFAAISETSSGVRVNGHEPVQPKTEPERRAEPVAIAATAQVVAPVMAPEAEPTPMDVDQEPKVSQHVAPAQPVEEPASRKMEVDENYDEESSDEAKMTEANKEPATGSGTDSQEARKTSPDVPASTNEHAVQPGEPASVEANA